MSWTQEELLIEAQNLINQIDQTEDPVEQTKIDGCFMAVQEVLIAYEEASEQRPAEASS